MTAHHLTGFYCSSLKMENMWKLGTHSISILFKELQKLQRNGHKAFFRKVISPLNGDTILTS